MAEELLDAIEVERLALAHVLDGLEPEQWATPSLCAGWTVREVVAHLTMSFRLSGPRFALEMVKARGNFNRMADRVARRDAAMSTATLAAAVRDNARNDWRPPGGGLEGALTHEVVHGLDITRPLGIERAVPAATLRVVLGQLVGARSLTFFGLDVAGVRLVADDLDWSHGEGADVEAHAEDLVLVLSGRMLDPQRLHGAGVAALGQPRP